MSRYMRLRSARRSRLATSIALATHSTDYAIQPLESRVLLSSITGDPNTPPISDAPNAVYPLDGDATDVSGNGYNGTLLVSTANRYGEPGKALDFDGVNDVITLPQAVADPATSAGFTVMAWAKADDLYYGGQNRVRPIVFQRKNGGDTYVSQFMLTLDGRGGDNVARFYLASTQSQNDTAVVSSPSNIITTNQWYHVAGVYDPSSHLMKLYLNGELVSSATHNLLPTVASSFDTTIGRTDYGDHFDGAIDDVRIYARALSDAEIRSNMTVNTPIPDAPNAVYPLDGDATDVSGNGYNGTLLGAPYDPVSTANRWGEPGKALDFDGVNDVITLPQAVADPATSSLGFTVMAWAKADDLYYGGQNLVRPIVFQRKYVGRSFVPQFELFLDGRGGNNRASFALASTVAVPGETADDGRAGVSSPSNLTIETSKWYHLAGVYEPSTPSIPENPSHPVMKLYVNGNLVSSATFNSLPTTASSYDMTIGRTDYGDHFDGKIDDVRIFARALSDTEIRSNMTDTPVNVAPVLSNVPGSATIDELAAYSFTATATDADVPAQTLTFSIIEAPAGAAIDPVTGVFSWTPTETQGPAAYNFTVRVSDGVANTDAPVTITVSEVNVAPVASDDAYATLEDATLSGVVTAIDVDGDSLTYALVAAPAHGTAIVNADGTFTYTPVANYNGPDSFSFKANDGSLDSNVATVSITVTPVNDAPVASDDAYGTLEDTTLTIVVPGILGNDTDLDGDTLVVSAYTQPGYGTVALTPDGGFTYTPGANYNGSDSFNYTISDGNGGESAATVSITVTPVNDAPVADEKALSTYVDVPVTVNLSGSDLETTAEQLVFTIASLPLEGVLFAQVDSSGVVSAVVVGQSFVGVPTLVYVPSVGTATTGVSFTYTVRDTGDGLATSLVSLPAVVSIALQQHTGITIVDGVLRVMTSNAASIITATNGALIVNGTVVSTAGLREIRIWTGNGNDLIDLSGLSIPLFIDAGAGDDSVTGGSASDSILGGSGNDVVRGSAGDDVMLGGPGADTLTGSSGNDILVAGDFGGATTLDAINALRLFWSNTAINTDESTATDVLIESDGETDVLTGSSGADWFIISHGDKVNDIGKNKRYLDDLLAGSYQFGTDVVTIVQ